MYSREPVKHDLKTQRLLRLIAQCEAVEVFKHDGRMYLGYFPEVVESFVKNNPKPADFGVWLQDNYKELTTN